MNTVQAFWFLIGSIFVSISFTIWFESYAVGSMVLGIASFLIAHEYTE